MIPYMRAKNRHSWIRSIGGACSHCMRIIVSRVLGVRPFEMFLSLSIAYFIISANGKEAGATALMIYILTKLQAVWYDKPKS